MRFGEYLVSKNLIQEEDITTAVEAQRQSKPHLGRMAVDMGYMSKVENLKVLMEQNKTKKRYGDIAKEKGLLNDEKISEILQVQKSESVPFGKILVEQGSLTREQLILALRDYSRLKDARQD